MNKDIENTKLNVKQESHRDEQFLEIKSYFENEDSITKSQGMPLHHDTKHGIWGPSGMDETYELFKKINLEKYNNFVDLGSGDGRISIIASLFTKSSGIEADHKLTQKAIIAFNSLNKTDSDLMNSCEFLEEDYTTTDLSKFDILFTFNDHTWNLEFEEKLLNECKGILFSYSRIFLPKHLKKGKTYWINGQAIVSYHLNTTEENLFSNNIIPSNK